MMVVMIENRMVAVVMERVEVMHVAKMATRPLSGIKMMACVTECGMNGARRVRCHWRPGRVPATGSDSNRVARHAHMTARPMSRVEVMADVAERGM